MTRVILGATTVKGPEPGTRPYRVVLCHLPHNDFTPFVTWYQGMDRTSDFFSGNYHGSEAEAQADFIERARKVGLIVTFLERVH